MKTALIVLSETLQAQIFAQMEAAYPNEGGGFLLGALEAETVTIREIVQIENVFAAEEQYHRYAMTPADWMRLEDDAEARGLTLVGYYHSHPNAAPIPSTFDRDHALPNFTYLITSVQAGKAVEMRGWRLRPDRQQFDEQTLKIAAAE
ncbi:MAG: M67 family metallopeptidase [Chloroflexi bacterium]|nr:M67 family metallopeptidase [Chloroflexota bacterium]